MKLRATVAGAEADVDVRHEAERVVALVADRKYELELHESGNGSYVLISKGVVFDCRVEGLPKSGETVDVFVGTSHYAVTLTDPKRLRGATSAGAHAHEAAQIIAPMPGKIVRVMVEIGAHIGAGVGIVVVEAMKMQNEMKSPIAGTVTSLNVQEGATVNAGEVLAVIE
jgi:biotin carboxyl carrier protein